MAKFIPEMFNVSIPLPGGGHGDAMLSQDQIVKSTPKESGDPPHSDEQWITSHLPSVNPEERPSAADGEQVTTEALQGPDGIPEAPQSPKRDVPSEASSLADDAGLAPRRMGLAKKPEPQRVYIPSQVLAGETKDQAIQRMAQELYEKLKAQVDDSSKGSPAD